MIMISKSIDFNAMQQNQPLIVQPSFLDFKLQLEFLITKQNEL